MKLCVVAWHGAESEELSFMLRKCEFTFQSSLAPMGMAWTCLVPRARKLCRPLWGLMPIPSGWKLYQCKMPCHVRLSRNFVLSSQPMAYQKCWCQTMAQYLPVQNSKSSHQGMQFSICSCFSVIPGIKWASRESSSIFQGRYEKDDLSALFSLLPPSFCFISTWHHTLPLATLQ